MILTESIEKSGISISVSNIKFVHHNTTFRKLASNLKDKARLSRLAYKVRRWFNESGETLPFRYRFTRQDSPSFLQNYICLIDAHRRLQDLDKEIFRIHVLAYTSRQLRQCVSKFLSDVHVNDEDLSKLKQHCTNFYRAQCLFNTVTLTT